MTQKELAAAIGVSAGYLSALEHGHRGRPSWALLQRIVGHFNIIWDNAEHLQQLAALSDTRVVVDTTRLGSTATLVANVLAERISTLPEERLSQMLELLKQPTDEGTHPHEAPSAMPASTTSRGTSSKPDPTSRSLARSPARSESEQTPKSEQ